MIAISARVSEARAPHLDVREAGAHAEDRSEAGNDLRDEMIGDARCAATQFLVEESLRRALDVHVIRAGDQRSGRQVGAERAHGIE
jgi:hypothetical protein